MAKGFIIVVVMVLEVFGGEVVNSFVAKEFINNDFREFLANSLALGIVAVIFNTTFESFRRREL
jgi:hypothetical protein